MTSQRPDSYVWVTWLTKLLAGDAHCEWATWFRAHNQGYAKRPSDLDLVTWKAQHAQLVRTTASDLRAAGHEVYVEDQNKFALRGAATTVGGVPDIVAKRDGRCVVIDCKTGQQRNSDVFQVLLYMLVMPHTHPACRDLEVAGRVQYPTMAIDLAPDRLSDQVKDLIRGTISRVGGTSPPPRVPSFSECRYCDLTRADCTDRVDDEPDGIRETNLF